MNLLSFTSAIILAFSVNVTGAENQGVFEVIHKYDEFAPHQEDPRNWSIGISQEKLIPGAAVKYCREAVLDYPGAPRFHFWHVGVA